ncbi:MAG: hypothetical protein ABR583_10930 [Gaiellaceae bacterium]
MTEPLPEPPAPRTTHEPKSPDSDLELARRNVRFGLLLFGLFVLLFAGTVVVALIYLAVD